MKRSKRRLGIAALSAAVLAALVATALPSGATIGSSTFEGNDGNLVVNTAGNLDWLTFIANPTTYNFHSAQDLPTGQTDNSFGQGTKEDDLTPTVVAGSIPNSKADLARFATASQIINNQVYLYLAWSRENQSGTVNFDIELNQKGQPDLTTPGVKTLNRTAGDVLINYAFAGGSNTPTLTRFTWDTDHWIQPGVVISSSFSEGATNGATVAENLFGASVNRPAQQFGEASINLTAAGIIPSGSCENFASGYIKSRSSTSFTSEIKDFIAPLTTNITNCGTLVVKKVTVPSPDPTNQSFNFSETGPNSFAPTFSLKNGGSDTRANLPVGTYTAAEGTPPTGWTLTGSSCDNGNPVTAIQITAGATVTCTFTNTGQGHLITKKVTSPSGSSQSFDFTTNAGPDASFKLTDGQTHDSGAVNAGTYNVAEGTEPTNWAPGNPASSCDDGSPVTAVVISPGETVTCTFNNVLQLGTVKVTKTHKVAGQGTPAEGGVVFTLNKSGVAVGTATTGPNGVACISGVPFGSYTLHETVPTGESPDAQDRPVTVNAIDTSSDCSGAAATAVSVVNTPLTDLTVHVVSEVAGGTSSTISCTNGGGSAGPGGDITNTKLGLAPGTYVCTVVIDP